MVIPDEGPVNPPLPEDAGPHERMLYNVYGFSSGLVRLTAEDWKSTSDAVELLATEVRSVVRKLQGADRPWTGPAADSAYATLHQLARQLDARAQEIKGVRTGLNRAADAADEARVAYSGTVRGVSTDVDRTDYETTPVRGPAVPDGTVFDRAGYDAAVAARREQREAEARTVLDSFSGAMGDAAKHMPVEAREDAVRIDPGASGGGGGGGNHPTGSYPGTGGYVPPSGGGGFVPDPAQQPPVGPPRPPQPPWDPPPDPDPTPYPTPVPDPAPPGADLDGGTTGTTTPGGPGSTGWAGTSPSGGAGGVGGGPGLGGAGGAVGGGMLAGGAGMLGKGLLGRMGAGGPGAAGRGPLVAGGTTGTSGARGGTGAAGRGAAGAGRPGVVAGGQGAAARGGGRGTGGVRGAKGAGRYGVPKVGDSARGGGRSAVAAGSGAGGRGRRGKDEQAQDVDHLTHEDEETWFEGEDDASPPVWR